MKFEVQSSSKSYNVLIRGLITFCYACIDTFTVFLMLDLSFFILFSPLVTNRFNFLVFKYRNPTIEHNIRCKKLSAA